MIGELTGSWLLELTFVGAITGAGELTFAGIASISFASASRPSEEPAAGLEVVSELADSLVMAGTVVVVLLVLGAGLATVSVLESAAGNELLLERLSL